MKQYINQDTRQAKALFKTYLNLVNTAGQQKAIFVKSMLFCIVSAALFGVALVFLYPFFMAFQAGDNALMIEKLLIVLALLLASFVFRVLSERYDANGYSSLAITELREKLGTKLRTISLEYLNQQRSGEINYILMQSVNEAAVYTFMLLSIIITGITIPIASAITLFFFDWRYAVVMLLVFPMAIPLYLWRRKAYRRGFSILAEANTKLKGEAIEFVQGLDVLKSTGQTDEKLNQFIRVTKDVENILRIGTKKGEVPNLIITSVVQIGLLLIILLGIVLVTSGSSSYLLLATVILVVARSADSLNFFVQMSSMLESFVIGYEKLQELLNIPSLAEKKDGVLPTEYDIVFEDVDFSYLNQDKTVLNDISLTIPAKSLTALVGASGCGKTTITKLILRFADVAAGRIKIGGVDIRDLSQEQLMSLIAVVFQDVYLFQDSILNNIRMAKTTASDEDVIAAAKLAQCHEFISRLPAGYHTQLADIGKSLSGGERQRIAIARAILKDAPILILDEPTAALDTQNELAVQEAINHLVLGKTVLLIAHRLSTIVGAQNIYVIDQGRVVEAGQHQDLIRQKGQYAEYWQIQQQINHH